MNLTPSPKIPAEILRRDCEEKWQRLFKKFPKHKGALKEISRDDLRMLEPWPDWVLRIASELIAVRYPRVEKIVILELLEFVHALFFGLRVKSPQSITAVGLRDNLIRLVGHLEAHTQRKFAEAEAKGVDSSELDALKMQRTEEFSKGWLMLMTALAKLNEAPFGIMEKAVDAKRATFDQNDNLRSTPATELYQAIFDNWQQVEKMSGQAELTEFLDPYLGKNRSQEQSYELVKKLCQRMEITFRPNLSRDKLGV
jgi:hypothetical protein